MLMLEWCAKPIDSAAVALQLTLTLCHPLYKCPIEKASLTLCVKLNGPLCVWGGGSTCHQHRPFGSVNDRRLKENVLSKNCNILKECVNSMFLCLCLSNLFLWNRFSKNQLKTLLFVVLLHFINLKLPKTNNFPWNLFLKYWIFCRALSGVLQKNPSCNRN